MRTCIYERLLDGLVLKVKIIRKYSIELGGTNFSFYFVRIFVSLNFTRSIRFYIIRLIEYWV